MKIAVFFQFYVLKSEEISWVKKVCEKHVNCEKNNSEKSENATVTYRTSGLSPNGEEEGNLLKYKGLYHMIPRFL